MADAKKKVDEAGAKGAGEGATMTPAEPTGKPEMSAQKPEKAPRLTRSQVVSQHAAQGGIEAVPRDCGGRTHAARYCRTDIA